MNMNPRHTTTKMENTEKRETTAETADKAVRNFIYYTKNYKIQEYTRRSGKKETVPDVIAQARWNCGREHITDKWHESKFDIVQLYLELSEENQNIMNQWIQENYKIG